MTSRIAVVDSYNLLVDAVAFGLSQDPDLEVVCKISSETQQEELCNAHADLVILGSNMGDFGDLGNPSELIPRLRMCSPESKILLVARPENPMSQLVDSLRAGADSAITAGSDMYEFMDAVHATLKGEGYLPVGLGTKLLQEGGTHETSPLSIREVKVLEGLAFGHTNQEIADRLHLSTRTIESHRAAIQDKLHLHSRAELVAYAMQHGFMSTDSEWMG